MVTLKCNSMRGVSTGEDVFQWLSLGWMRHIVRLDIGVWTDVAPGDVLRVRSEGQSDPIVLVIHEVERAEKLDELVDASNYISVYPHATSVGVARRYTVNYLHNNRVGTEGIGYVIMKVAPPTKLEEQIHADILSPT